MPIPDTEYWGSSDKPETLIPLTTTSAGSKTVAQMRELAQMFPSHPNMTEAEELLGEWAYWWASTDAEPKLPKALQVRTALYFHKRAPHVQGSITMSGTAAAQVSQTLRKP